MKIGKIGITEIIMRTSYLWVKETKIIIKIGGEYGNVKIVLIIMCGVVHTVGTVVEMTIKQLRALAEFRRRKTTRGCR